MGSRLIRGRRRRTRSLVALPWPSRKRHVERSEHLQISKERTRREGLSSFPPFPPAVFLLLASAGHQKTGRTRTHTHKHTRAHKHTQARSQAHTRTSTRAGTRTSARTRTRTHARRRRQTGGEQPTNRPQGGRASLQTYLGTDLSLSSA